ncbi:DUF6909 family protein [Aquimarina agarilytica]|uniref:DUF6909 family protein n=1 Tax=Aquimarina agarilytica TaxID=1087449 RepID=UPI0002898140|nr:hypothetical protein [Aquimarina agarilytica]
MQNYIAKNEQTRAQESTNAIERLYIGMRHLFNRGYYKPMGVSGETLREALLILRPEIYGSINEDKVELNGLLYVLDRLPEGIEECRFVNLTSEEGYKNAHFEVIIPKKRRRNCYRVDEDQMNIEITRGRSEIYDILTHLTFMYMESEKIRKQIQQEDDLCFTRDWNKLVKFAVQKTLSDKDRDIAMAHLANILGRSFNEIIEVYDKFASPQNPDRFIYVIYGLGKLSLEEVTEKNKREITFSPVLRERIGHHIHSSFWAYQIKKRIHNLNLFERPLHIISSNMHSVMNSLFAKEAFGVEYANKTDMEIYELLSNDQSKDLRNTVKSYALKHGMVMLADSSSSHINVQLFDTSKIAHLPTYNDPKSPVILVMDYAFGEQAFEAMDELLKPYKAPNETLFYMNVVSVSIMGKAGILQGGKGDLMIPTAHILEGTSGNYPFKNELSLKDFEGTDIDCYEGSMVTVLGTSLQNRDLLQFFHDSTWKVIGLEMEGAHYQKAIQAASKIRKSIIENIQVRYAYYASDNPLETGSTLASGGLGTSGVKPTYTITKKIIEQILETS